MAFIIHGTTGVVKQKEGPCSIGAGILPSVLPLRKKTVKLSNDLLHSEASDLLLITNNAQLIDPGELPANSYKYRD